MKEFADDNFKFDENDKKFSKQVEKTVGKGEITSNFSFSHSVFNRPVMQTRKKQGLFGKGLTFYLTTKFWTFRLQGNFRQHIKYIPEIMTCVKDKLEIIVGKGVKLLVFKELVSEGRENSAFYGKRSRFGIL